MEEEIWKKIDGYDNYSVSNFGNVRNDKTNKILKGRRSKNKYLQVNLYIEKVRKQYSIHRLVGLAFLENPENKSEIDHIDRNNTNNHLSNLRWASRTEQVRNTKKRENTSSKYKGVYLKKEIMKYQSYIYIGGNKKHLGLFETEEEAGLAYNNYIKEHQLEEFFILNQIENNKI